MRHQATTRCHASLALFQLFSHLPPYLQLASHLVCGARSGAFETLCLLCLTETSLDETPTSDRPSESCGGEGRPRQARARGKRATFPATPLTTAPSNIVLQPTAPLSPLDRTALAKSHRTYAHPTPPLTLSPWSPRPKITAMASADPFDSALYVKASVRCPSRLTC